MRRTFTAEEKASVFELWKNGTGFSEIANILGSKPGTIFTMLRDTGGIKPHERKRAVAHLTLSEREEIRAGLSAKMSIRAIATALSHTDNAVFLTTDGTNFCLDRKSLAVSSLNQLSGLLYVLSDRIMRTIKHDGRETSFDALVAAFKRAMIQMQRNGNINVQIL